MHLKEIVLDGFRSYAVRTVVSGFDREFNAITGLNGSGKSNILDSICFVLGISNLSQVRAANLQELVYKQGQAGVQKASVTLIFDNTDTENSPLGYEQNTEITVTRQVVIGGRNKYLINAHTAQLSQVQNLFHSVQLNVNNPHFLIMQGRITKVLNMKPPEILSMLEEAAGTRLFEQKKEAALKTIEKKSKKVEEITTVLEDEISPTLEKLRGERAGYMKWSSNGTEIERLERFSTGHDYHQADSTRSECVDKAKTVQDELDALTAEQEESMAVVAAQNTEIEELTQSKEQEMGSEFKEIEHQVTEKSKKMVKQTSAWQNKKETYDKEVEACAGMHDAIADAGKQQETMKTKKVTAEEDCAKHQQAADAAVAEADEMQRKFLAGELSVDSGEGNTGSLADQLEVSKATVTTSTTNAKQLETKIKHLRKEQEAKQKAEGKGKKEYAKMMSEQQKLETELKTITINLMELDYDEAQEQALLSKKTELELTISQLQAKVDELSSRLSRIQFDYSDPAKNFDRSKVKGLVAELLELKDVSTATALETTAGGSLYSAVVDTDTTGKMLLKNGKLKKRVTIIPLNKIDTRGSIPDSKLKAAEKSVGKTNVSAALSLIEFESDVEPAMKYVFGRSFVCRDSKSAREVTFNKDIRTRCVTLDGDEFKPTGTLSGGSRQQSASVLERLQSLTAAKKELEQHQQLLARIDEQLAAVHQTATAYHQLKNKKEMKSHETELIKQRIAASAHSQQQSELQLLETDINTARESLVAAIEEKKTAEARCKELQSSIKNFEKDRAKQMKEIEATVAKSKKEAATATKKAKATAQKVESITLEMGETVKEVGDMQEQVKEREAALAVAATEVAELETLAGDRKREYEEAKLELDSRRQRISECEKQIVKLAKARNAAQKKAEKADLEAKRVAHKVTRMEKDSAAASRLIESLVAKFPWIESEKHLFGQQKSEYDFSRRSPGAAREKLVELRDEQDKLSKKINKKVMSMFEKAEQEYQDLKHRKSIIENDKDKIEKVIGELDAKKNETLKKTWAKVNRDFGSIFSTLLPGANAKLEPEEGKSVLDGLTVCVALGSVWKESLTELSGGQRSLLALSLVLSLLLFKPAPMYILDEVDAALDLSHTQNIGAMIKNHFKHSQFIVVSLKEGMFQNANVLFRTKFVDGVSTVTRTTNVSGR